MCKLDLANDFALNYKNKIKVIACLCSSTLDLYKILLTSVQHFRLQIFTFMMLVRLAYYFASDSGHAEL